MREQPKFPQAGLSAKGSPVDRSKRLARAIRINLRSFGQVGLWFICQNWDIPAGSSIIDGVGEAKFDADMDMGATAFLGQPQVERAGCGHHGPMRLLNGHDVPFSVASSEEESGCARERVSEFEMLVVLVPPPSPLATLPVLDATLTPDAAFMPSSTPLSSTPRSRLLRHEKLRLLKKLHWCRNAYDDNISRASQLQKF
ncbi:hypothetical protein B0H11DRAFT_1918625 [Mycena galericulata]|nr:hypothetical protein B0H11DRAFT_1918625 [Mycena galericulata]